MEMLRWFAGLLAVFCLLAVVRVEWLDHQAGGAIRQKLELEPDFKWRMSRDSSADPSPYDRVGDALSVWGLALHPAAIVLTLVALFRQARDGTKRLGWTVLATLGMGFLALAIYRQYFASLGW